MPTGRSLLPLLCCAASLACAPASEGDGNGKPGAFRIARAVLTNLLSNRVGTRDEGTPPPAAPRDPQPLLAAETPVADPPESCRVPYSGPVTIIPVRSSAAIARSLAERREVPVVYETDDTAIWRDGRVMTTDVENLGHHLDALGWAANPMTIAGAGIRPGGSNRNLGWNSSTSSFQESDGRKRKRTRRRG